MRMWRNGSTRRSQKPFPKGVRVQVPPSAPSFTERWRNGHRIGLLTRPAFGLSEFESLSLRHIGKLTRQGPGVGWKPNGSARSRVQILSFPPFLEARAMVLTALEKQHMVLSHDRVRFPTLPPVWRVPLTVRQIGLNPMAPKGRLFDSATLLHICMSRREGMAVGCNPNVP